MAIVALSASPATLDSGGSEFVTVTNTGAVDVTVSRGPQSFTLRPNQSRTVYPEGSAVTAVASGSGQVTTLAQAAQVTQSQQVAANTAAVAVNAAAIAALPNTYAGISPRVPTVPATTLVCEDPYTLSASFTHPDVLYIPAGWGSDSNGKAWKYWMVNTPYWHAEAAYENPSVFVSNDGIVWQTPAGGTNPIDGVPGVNKYNSDPDLYFVGSTLYCVYREHDTSTGMEYIRYRSTTNGITWSAEGTFFDSTGLTPLNRLNLISPAVCFDGTTYHMYYSQQTSQILHRTSTDGVTWGSASAISMPGYVNSGIWHLDVVYDNGKFHLLTQDTQSDATGQVQFAGRSLWIGKSTNGTSFTYQAKPLITSDGFAQRTVYRSSLLHSTRAGKDYYTVYVSGASYSVDLSTAAQTADAAGTGVESWYIGRTEGWDPNDLPANSAMGSDFGIYMATGDIVTEGHIKAEDLGAGRFFARIAKAARMVVDRFRASEVHTQALYVDGPTQDMSLIANAADWVAGFGYGQNALFLPSLVLANDPTAPSNNAPAGIDLRQRASDATINAGDFWRMDVSSSGRFVIRYWLNSTHTMSAMFQMDGSGQIFTPTGGLSWDKLVTQASGYVRTGRAVTGSRPSASTAGSGAMFYDTTLSKPIWSDGTTWRDATGTAV